MRRYSAHFAGVAAAVALSGCGGGDKAPTPNPAEDAGTKVIREWADTLRAGDVEGASKLFAVPSIVANGTPRLKLESAEAVRFFNGSLPCGARLLSTRRDGGRLIAKFRLTDRPGGACGQGTGNVAYTQFLIDKGHIVEWIRVEGPGEGSEGEDAQSV